VIDLSRIADDVVPGDDVSAVALVTMYGCTVGEHDLMPRATREDGSLQTTEDRDLLPTRTRRRARTGSGAVIPARNLRTLDQGALT
jgi:hypothetical protein